jgi:hypothetical protein
MEDVAGATRTLLAFGKGDAVIHRLCVRFGLTAPLVEVGEEVTIAKGTIFALSRIPTNQDEREKGPNEGPITELELTDWLKSTAVVSATASRHVTSWAQLITDFGNTFGAHVSSSVPDSLSQIGVFLGPRGTLGDLALRSAAIVAENSLNTLLPLLGQAPTRESPRLFHSDQPGITYFGMRYERGAVAASVVMFGRPNAEKGAVLVTYPIDGQTMRLTWLGEKDGMGQVGVSVQ